MYHGGNKDGSDWIKVEWKVVREDEKVWGERKVVSELLHKGVNQDRSGRISK